MATVLVYTSPARGHLFPLLPTLLELRARGHRVQVRTLAGEVGRLRELGLEAEPLAPAIEGRDLDDWKAKTPIGALHRTFTAWLERAEHEVGDLRAALAGSGADVVLVDINSWGALAAAEASGVPFAVFAPYFLNIRAPGRPPFGLGLPPATGLFGRVRDAVLWAVTRLAGRPYLGRLNALRTRLHLPALSALDGLTTPAHRVLAYTSVPFEYTHGGWPANVRFVGPGLWEPEGAPDAGDPRPLVLVTCSTEFQDDGKLIETALAALDGEDVAVVATTGAIDPATFRAPANARVVRFAAHGPLLRRAVAVVCHGGMGITQKALAAGVPVCVVPWGRDQNDVARHVAIAGAGGFVPRAKLTVPRLREAIRVTRGRRDGAARIAAAFAASGGAARAADQVEELLPEPQAGAGRVAR
jgi:MGT family glycosyltransferase